VSVANLQNVKREIATALVSAKQLCAVHAHAFCSGLTACGAPADFTRAPFFAFLVADGAG
jgi:hypothetical protein